MPSTATEAIKNTILVYEDASQVLHRFCTEVEGRDHLQHTTDNGSGASMFVTEGMTAELVYSVAPVVRSRVEEAKCKLRQEIAVRDTLTRHGVPVDRDLRKKIFAAIKELREAALLPAA
ncbi:hypothetical protein [Rubrivivax gelatinosus]|uniref:hypothetical protein n=1 Tax=Rubrivivax gelatinosus TaxID=28068 RepID=UPI0002DC73DA|nr:hypothetical protein [Rubrivivax gelatinosus]MBG6083115.1 hypothetical protein [Rubrivivax gelatinosus]